MVPKMKGIKADCLKICWQGEEYSGQWRRTCSRSFGKGLGLCGCDGGRVDVCEGGGECDWEAGVRKTAMRSSKDQVGERGRERVT